MVGRILRPLGIGIAHKPVQTLRTTVMRVKDNLPDQEKSGVIYKIDCKDCQKHYIGETKRRLKTRLKEHEAAFSKRKDLNSNVVLHGLEENHHFDFEGAKVVGLSQSHAGRLLKEAWFSDHLSINDHIPLPPAYEKLKKAYTSLTKKSVRIDYQPN